MTKAFLIVNTLHSQSSQTQYKRLLLLSTVWNFRTTANGGKTISKPSNVTGLKCKETVKSNTWKENDNYGEYATIKVVEFDHFMMGEQ